MKEAQEHVWVIWSCFAFGGRKVYARKSGIQFIFAGLLTAGKHVCFYLTGAMLSPFRECAKLICLELVTVEFLRLLQEVATQSQQDIAEK